MKLLFFNKIDKNSNIYNIFISGSSIGSRSIHNRRALLRRANNCCSKIQQQYNPIVLQPI
jgi:hypothetical protein